MKQCHYIYTFWAIAVLLCLPTIARGNGQYSIAVGQYPAGMYLYEVLDAKSTSVLKRGKLLVAK